MCLTAFLFVCTQLGEVMKESTTVALTVAKRKLTTRRPKRETKLTPFFRSDQLQARGLNVDFFKKNVVHIHCLEGAVPKVSWGWMDGIGESSRD